MAAFAASPAAELVLEVGGARLELRKGVPLAVGPASPAAAAATALPAAASAAPAAAGPLPPAPGGLVAVPAPVDGLFYRAPSPVDPPYVSPGDSVPAGHVLGLVEVMKTMMEVRSPCPGAVRAVLAENGAMIQAGRTLFELEVQAGAGG